MDDGARSTYMKKPRKRVLVVSNASPESSEDDMAPPEPPKPRTFPRPLPSPSRSFPSAEAYPPERFHSGPGSSHIPTPLTTNLHCYPRSNPSNPALSSPSSTSSPAVESTPPPSTPGLSGSTIQLNEEGTIRQDMITSAGSDRNENTPQARPRQFVRPSTQSNARRYSSSGSRPATSPTVSTPDSYMPTPPHVFRSNPMDKAIVLVTTDAENLHIVDITGAMTPAFIRERIFTKVRAHNRRSEGPQ
ncbi:hypothetical protein K466DRAFT_195112 [Polyporus arcularius HHB13444]|uniref:Uncharacterized protein n=1 Tax=Polyporus arcularius HHB13444 TaxID=1314778 RepID=A0A5C3PT19_9APHY|nr:hypothetical protein K466DRAFT_195112 [Polyporus arcularius HHB13444]